MNDKTTHAARMEQKEGIGVGGNAPESSVNEAPAETEPLDGNIPVPEEVEQSEGAGEAIETKDPIPSEAPEEPSNELPQTEASNENID